MASAPSFRQKSFMDCNRAPTKVPGEWLETCPEFSQPIAGTELPDPARLFNEGGENNTNIRSIRVTSGEGWNRPALRALLRTAVELDADPAIPPAPKVKRAPWPVPDFFKTALAKKRHTPAAASFKSLSPSCQREFLAWLSTAKRPETRKRRLKQTLAARVKGRKWISRRET